MTIICCWWMLRGIETAAARLADVWFETTAFGRMVLFTLPCHKTDTVGLCITRSHPCTCSDNLAALCPYHTLETFIRCNHVPNTTRTDEYLFYGRQGGAITHLETIEVFRNAIASTGAELTRLGPQGQVLHRFNEHVCRVSGSQFLTRLGYPFETVQLIGRWGSDAVRKYVQEAPLSCVSGSSARPSINRTPTHSTVRTMVKRYLETITSKFWVKNTVAGAIHISGAPEFSTESIHWHTLCGWRYGRAPHTKFWSVPGQPMSEVLPDAGEPSHHGWKQR